MSRQDALLELALAALNVAQKRHSPDAHCSLLYAAGAAVLNDCPWLDQPTKTDAVHCLYQQLFPEHASRIG